VAKFEALFLYCFERTEEDDYKLWSRGRNLNFHLTAYEKLTRSVAGAGGFGNNGCCVYVRACVCVCVFECLCFSYE
jgi:hypothetical protein